MNSGALNRKIKKKHLNIKHNFYEIFTELNVSATYVHNEGEV